MMSSGSAPRLDDCFAVLTIPLKREEIKGREWEHRRQNRKKERKEELRTSGLDTAGQLNGLLLVPYGPAPDLLLPHATEQRLLLRLIKLSQQFRVHPHILQDLLQHLQAHTWYMWFNAIIPTAEDCVLWTANDWGGERGNNWLWGRVLLEKPTLN